MELKAIRPVYVGGRLVAPGVPFSTTDEHGQTLEKSGDARADKPQAKPKAKAEEK